MKSQVIPEYKKSRAIYLTESEINIHFFKSLMRPFGSPAVSERQHCKEGNSVSIT